MIKFRIFKYVFPGFENLPLFNCFRNVNQSFFNYCPFEQCWRANIKTHLLLTLGIACLATGWWGRRGGALCSWSHALNVILEKTIISLQCTFMLGSFFWDQMSSIWESMLHWYHITYYWAFCTPLFLIKYFWWSEHWGKYFQIILNNLKWVFKKDICWSKI